MVDGFKAISTDNLDEIRNNPLHDFYVPLSISTGEVKDRKYPEAKYKRLLFIDKITHIELRGSIHTFYNNGKHNYDKFNMSKIKVAIYELANQHGIVTNLARLTNLEIGINLILDFNPNLFLNSIIRHRGKKFNFREGKNMCYLECIHGQFIIKIYNKGLQYSLNKYVLRVEIKYIKMEKPNSFGIKYLSDIIDEHKLKKLSNELLRVFDEILIGDMSVTPKGLNSRDELLYANGHNANYWDEILPRSKNFEFEGADKAYKRELRAYERKQTRFKKLLVRTGANYRKCKVRKLMEQEIERLLEPNSQEQNAKLNRGKLTKDILKNRKSVLRELHKKTWEIDHIESDTNKNLREINNNQKTWEIDPLLYSVKNPHTGNRSKRFCVRTGLDISMQKSNSRFLCTEAIKFYKKYYPEIWEQLLQRLSPRWHDSPEEIKIQEIHHSIRNEYFNQIHNTKRSIKRLLEEPALFNQLNIIRHDKLEIAGFPY